MFISGSYEFVMCIACQACPLNRLPCVLLIVKCDVTTPGIVSAAQPSNVVFLPDSILVKYQELITVNDVSAHVLATPRILDRIPCQQL
jgi:hypothetical protein